MSPIAGSARGTPSRMRRLKKCVRRTEGQSAEGERPCDAGKGASMNTDAIRSALVSTLGAARATVLGFARLRLQAMSHRPGRAKVAFLCSRNSNRMECHCAW